MSKSIKQIQVEHAIWEKSNFGDTTMGKAFLGMVEEIGELAHHDLKESQGIRVNEDHIAGAQDCVGDIVIYMVSYCNARGWDLQEIIEKTWDKVSKRDWTKNKINGGYD
jgi:NTP pyrophosphatase (non-canonical NTP hydrolase)